ncbi:MAG: ATP-binding protein [Pseudodesulfovibrio sp.]
MLYRNVAVTGVVVLLAALLMFIVWGNYSAQVGLRQASMGRFSDYAARQAASLGHFLSDRMNDLDDLSTSRELQAYYENKALGMSREYGLWVSQVAISELLGRFVRRKTMDGGRVYRRIAYLDDTGHLLADDQGVPDSPECCPERVPANLDEVRTSVRFVDEGGGRQLVLFLPYLHKGVRTGILMAWLNTDAVLSSIMEDFNQAHDRWFNYVQYGTSLYCPMHTVPVSLERLVATGWPPEAGVVVDHRLATEANGEVDFLAVRSPVDGSDFSLLTLAPRAQLLGTVSPGRLLFYTVLIGALLLGGGGAILWFSARNLMLGAQVKEAARQARIVEDKNRQLEAEIGARTAAETALHEANEDLEERVRQRTGDLEERTLALSREVAERREAESAMRFIFNNTHDAIFIHGLDGSIIDVNQRMLDMYRVARGEALSLSIADDYSGPEASREFLDDCWQRVVNGENVGFEWIARRPGDGHLFDVQVSLNRIEMGGRSVIFANVHDISEEKRRLSEQQEHQEFLNTVFEGIGAAIFVFDPERGETVDCNVVGERLLSLGREEILRASCGVMVRFAGQKQQDLLCPEWHDRNEYGEGMLVLADESTIPVSLHTFEIFIGGKAHLVQVVFNIAERKTLERKLNIAQKLESLGQLASGIAHEINTPIQYVGDSVRFVKDALEDLFRLVELYAATLAGEDGSEAIEELRDDMDWDFVHEEMPKACDRALEGVGRVASIVLAMKNFSHPGGEEAKLVDINRAIENTVTVTRNEWKYAADLEARLDPDMPLVHCFPGGLNQVLLNIIINAAHAIAGNESTGEKGLIAVTTSFDGDWAEIRVADSGCGIPKENMTKIFDPFFTTKEVGKGTGQGLAIVHDIVVEKHGGTIDVESEVGVGTTFIVRLPIDGPAQ